MAAYQLLDVAHCNMCRAPVSGAKTLGRRLNTRQGLRPTRRVGLATTVMRCRGCGLVFSNPMPLPEDVGQHYEVDPEAYWDDHYLANGDGDLTDYADRFRSLWQGDGTPVALDVGAGLGHSMLALAAKGFDVYGIEPSRAFRDRALQQPTLTADRLVETTIENAKFQADSFDYVSFGAVLEHLPDPAGSLERALSWTRADGLIWVAVPSSRWLVARAVNALYRAQGLDYVTNISPMHSPFHLYEFTRESFELHGQRAGYEIADSRGVVCDPFVPGPLASIARRMMDATGTGMMLEVWLRATT